MTDELPRGHRGTGIFVLGGDFRIKGLSLVIGPHGIESPNPIRTEVRTDTFRYWLSVAHDAVARSEVAREAGVEAGPDDAFHAAIESEFRASLVAVSAAAFALDAFFASVVHKAPQTRVRTKRRATTLTETFKRAFVLTNEQARAMHQPMRDVFRFRRQAVHPPEEFAAPVAHPVFGLGMEPRFVMFSTENASTATLFAHRVIWLCLHRPKLRWPELVAWADAVKGQVEKPADPS